MNEAYPGEGILVLASGKHDYFLVAHGGSYTVKNSKGQPMFGLNRVTLGTAFAGAVELLHADLTSEALGHSLEDLASELSSLGVSAAVRQGKLMIRTRPDADHVAFASRDADRPWLWEVLSGDVASDAFPRPLTMPWPLLCTAATEAAI